MIRSNYIPTLAALIGGVFYLLLHLMAGPSLPFPVGDEVVFYYPAQALAQHGTLHSPHLHPTSELFWMPPGFMALLAGWMQLFGYGLIEARWLPFALSLCAFAGLLHLFIRWQVPAPAYALLVLLILSRHWLVMGNMVRMEPLLFCLWLPGILLAYQGRAIAAFSLFAASLTVHPNGIYLLAALPVLLWLSPAERQAHKVDIVLAALAVLICLGYALHVQANWSLFLHDWRYQLASRSAGGVATLLLRPDMAVFLVGWLALAVWAWRNWGRLPQAGYMLAVAGTLWVMRILGQGWSYGVFNVTAVILTLLVGLLWLERQTLPAWLKPQTAGWLAAMLLAVGLYFGKIYNIPFHRADYDWMGMSIQKADKPYFTKIDRAAVQAYLYKTLPPSHQSSIYFEPEGDGMLVGPADTGRWLHVLPCFGSILPDYFVVHQSEMAGFFNEAYAETISIIADTTDFKPFYQRQGTEKWYLIKTQGKYPPYIKTPSDPWSR